MVSMDAEFIDFLDKKFQKLSDEIKGVQFTLGERIDVVEMRQQKTEQLLNNLTNTIDKFLQHLDDVKVEQKMITADIFRIKQVIKEKLGVEI